MGGNSPTFPMKIFWTKTGDTLNVDVENQQFVDYWLDSLKQDNKDQFQLMSNEFPDQIDSEVKSLRDKVTSINEYLAKFKLEQFSLPESTVDIITSNTLNRLHSYWTYLVRKQNMTTMFSKLYPQYVKTFLDINHAIHNIEKTHSLSFCVDENQLWRTENIFGDSILKFGSWHLMLGFNNVGKTYYDKWWQYDTNFVDHDTNNYSHFGGILDVTFYRSFVEIPPQAYLNFCHQNQIKPLGNRVPIGNFKEEIDKAKQIFYTNTKIENNYIQLEKD